MHHKIYISSLTVVIFLMQVGIISAWGVFGTLWPLLLWELLFFYHYHDTRNIYLWIAAGICLDLVYNLPAVNTISLLIIYLFNVYFFSRWFVFKNFLSWSLFGLLACSLYFWLDYLLLVLLNFWRDTTINQFNTSQFGYYLLLNFLLLVIIYSFRLISNKKSKK